MNKLIKEKIFLDEHKNISDNEFSILAELYRIRNYELQISQKELSKKCGVSQEVISRLESGTHSTTLRLMCKILNSIGYELVIKKKEIK